MSIYGNVKPLEEAVLDNIPALECESESYVGMALEFALTVQESYNEFLEGVGTDEIGAYVESEGDGPVVYTEGRLTSLKEKAQKIFDTIIAKIKGIIAKVVAKFDQFIRTNQSFASKYKPLLEKNKSKIGSFKYDGYKFNIPELPDLSAIDSVEAARSKFGMKEFSGGHVADTSESSASFRGEKGEQTFTVDEVIAVLTKKNNEAARVAGEFKKLISKANAAKAEIAKGKEGKEGETPDEAEVKKINDLIKEKSAIINLAIKYGAAYTMAVHAEIAQARSIAIKMVASVHGAAPEAKPEKDKPEAKAESADLSAGFIADCVIK